MNKNEEMFLIEMDIIKKQIGDGGVEKYPVKKEKKEKSHAKENEK